MTGKSSDHLDKSGNNRISLATVKDEFAPLRRNSLLVEEKVTEIGYEILKENHEILLSDYESLKQRFKDVEETYKVTKLELENKTKEFEEMKIRLLEVNSMEKSEKERYKKMLEEVKIVVNEGKARIKNQELTLEKGQEKNKELEKLENKYGQLEEKLDVVKIEVSSLKSLYDTELVSGTANAVISGNENLDQEGNNEDAILISDDSEGEDDNTLKEQCKKVIDFLIENQASADIFSPK